MNCITHLLFFSQTPVDGLICDFTSVRFIGILPQPNTVHNIDLTPITYIHTQLTTAIPSSYSKSGGGGSGSRLSTGSIVGVVVGGVVAGAALLFGLAFLMRKRIIKRKLFNATLLGSKPSRPFLDNELEDMEDPRPGPVSVAVLISFHLVVVLFTRILTTAQPSLLCSAMHIFCCLART